MNYYLFTFIKSEVRCCELSRTIAYFLYKIQYKKKEKNKSYVFLLLIAKSDSANMSKILGQKIASLEVGY